MNGHAEVRSGQRPTNRWSPEHRRAGRPVAVNACGRLRPRWKRQNLRLLVDDRAKEEENHFFACRVDGHDWIFWREGRLLMPTVFEAAVGDKEINADQIWQLRIRYCRKPIDLDSGVVPRKEDIGSSTFLVTQDFVSRIVYACTLNGELVLVKKRPNLK